MFNWLKEKATKAAATQCKFNIRLNTKKLVSTANRADELIKASDSNTNDNNTSDIASAQKRLLADMTLGNSKGISLETIKSDVIDPLLQKIEVTSRAKIAVDDVFKSAARIIED